MPHPGPPIPAAPFVAWLHRQLETLRNDVSLSGRNNPAVNSALAERLGISRRRLHDYLNSRDGYRQHTETFGRWRVEDMLENAGLMLSDVYPDLPREEIELEPDAWCERCCDIVTPIKGICPWCDSTPIPMLQVAA